MEHAGPKNRHDVRVLQSGQLDVLIMIVHGDLQNDRPIPQPDLPRQERLSRTAAPEFGDQPAILHHVPNVKRGVAGMSAVQAHLDRDLRIHRVAYARRFRGGESGQIQESTFHHLFSVSE